MKLLIFTLILFCAVIALPANLLKNSDFSAKNNYMQHWTLTTMCDQVFDLSYSNKGKFVELESTGTEYSGYINQFVRVKPNTKYLLRVNIRHIKGRLFLWMVGYDEKRQPIGFQKYKWLSSSVGHPLVPNFVLPKYVRGSNKVEWKIETVEFITKKPMKSKKEVAFINVNVGVYFSTGKFQVKKIELIELNDNKIKETK